MSTDDLNTSIFGRVVAEKDLGRALKSRKTKSKMGVMEEVGEDIKNPFEGRTKAGGDLFEMLERVPIFTGSEDVEEWLLKVGFLFEKYPNREEELIEGFHYRLAGKTAQFLGVEGGCVGSFRDLRVIIMEIFQAGDSDSVNIFPSVSASTRGIRSRL
jgi:hypothetical protein